MQLVTPELEQTVDAIARRVPGFYIGRFDIRYHDEASLKAGRGLMIVELNGASAEATSIYDAKNSVWQAYRTLFMQWRLVFEIGAANRRLGVKPATLREVWLGWRSMCEKVAGLPVSD
jgi:hypothetical protein